MELANGVYAGLGHAGEERMATGAADWRQTRRYSYRAPRGRVGGGRVRVRVLAGGS